MNKAEAEILAAAEDRGTSLLVLIILFAVMIFAGLIYIDRYGGGFSPLVYSPYRSMEEVVAMQPVAGGDEAIFRKGKFLFSANCAVCHQENGSGNPQNGCPPLAGSEWVAAPGPGRMIRIISKGLTGPIDVKGQMWNTGQMLAAGDQMLAADEKERSENIAAIISYVRKAFGKDGAAIKPDKVQAVREQIQSHSGYFTVDELKSVPENE